MAKEHFCRLIKEELIQCNEHYKFIKNHNRTKKLKRVMLYFEEHLSRPETVGISEILVERGKEALFIHKKSKVLQFRLNLLKVNVVQGVRRIDVHRYFLMQLIKN